MDEQDDDWDPGDRYAPDWSEIRDERVRRAVRSVPRAAFVPARLRRWANRDAPLPIGYEQTISQPFIVALMTQALSVQPGERVLEIGTGSGFQTAVLCELAAVEGRPKGETVYSVERYQRLAQSAQARLHRLGYYPAVLWGDGALGWPQGGLFDAIMVTAAPRALPRPLWEQLAEGGRMVIPVGDLPENQYLWLLRKHNAGMVSRRLGAVRFVPLVSPVLDEPGQRMAIAT